MLLKSVFLGGGLLGLVAAETKCLASGFPALDIWGLEILHVEATKQKDHVVGFNPLSNLPHSPVPISFCNVTVSYTHPGQNNVINVAIWLPLEGWNGRLLGQGGAGYLAGGEILGQGVAMGYATANTDAGHTAQGDLFDTALGSRGWALSSKGNVNWSLLVDFASRAVEDLPRIAKQVIKSVYGKDPEYSYWNGCSTGGRQGMMLAQRAPEEFDGILAIAPAINWATFLVAEQWPQLLMRKADYYPAECEWEAIRAAAIEACDGLDGVNDGMIAAPGLCKFDASSVVGSSYDCAGDKRDISPEAADLANAIWKGPLRDGKQIWFGLPHETVLGSPGPFGGLASTTCDEKARNCQPAPFPISADWVTMFLAKDPDFDISSMTEEQFWNFMDLSQKSYASIMNADSPDLSRFKNMGRKLISWHGLADQLIFANGSSSYFNRVEAQDPEVRDYFRLFESPGAQHCFGGHGVTPTSALESLVQWVEYGKAPDSLAAASTPAEDLTPVKTRILCPYPQVAVYQRGDENDAASFRCGNSFGASIKSGGGGHGEL